MDKLRNILGLVAVVVGLIGTTYALGLSSGWFVNKALAQQIATDTTVLAQQDTQLELLELKRQLKFNQLRLLNNKAAQAPLNPDEELEAEILRSEIELIQETINTIKTSKG